MNEAAADGGWGLGPAYRCKPATKPGFETVIWQFEAPGGVRARISPVGSERGGHLARNSPGRSQCARTQMLSSSPLFFLPKRTQALIISPAAEGWRAW